MMSATFLLLIAFAYLCGSIPFGKIAGKLYGIDIQKHGSRNIGFANAVRVLGWKAGLVVLPCDVLKGSLPTLVAKQYLTTGHVMVVAAAAILGHVFPIWLKFRGGKGIATGLGVTLAINPVIGVLGLLVYALGLVIFRKSAPSSIAAAWSLPFWCLAYGPQYTPFYSLLAVVIIWTHRNNIRQMIDESAYFGQR